MIIDCIELHFIFTSFINQSCFRPSLQSISPSLSTRPKLDKVMLPIRRRNWLTQQKVNRKLLPLELRLTEAERALWLRNRSRIERYWEKGSEKSWREGRGRRGRRRSTKWDMLVDPFPLLTTLSGSSDVSKTGERELTRWGFASVEQRRRLNF